GGRLRRFPGSSFLGTCHTDTLTFPALRGAPPIRRRPHGALRPLAARGAAPRARRGCRREEADARGAGVHRRRRAVGQQRGGSQPLADELRPRQLPGPGRQGLSLAGVRHAARRQLGPAAVLRRAPGKGLRRGCAAACGPRARHHEVRLHEAARCVQDQAHLRRGLPDDDAAQRAAQAEQVPGDLLQQQD
ncbi:unnamed protein product, partial [Prorocentrum cordatum]